MPGSIFVVGSLGHVVGKTYISLNSYIDEPSLEVRGTAGTPPPPAERRRSALSLKNWGILSSNESVSMFQYNSIFGRFHA